MTRTALPTSSPSEQGVDADGILRLIDALEASPTQDPHSLMILRHGHVIAQGWWAPYAGRRRHLLYSLSKSFTSAAAGLAIAEGLLDLDATAVSYFPEFDADVTDARSRAILVRHLASMATGHTFDTLEQAQQTDPADPVRGFLLTPPDRDPGSVFAYNQPATYTLAAIIQKQAGLTLIDYLRPRLLDPLGIGPVGWQQYPAGRNLGFTGLFATTDAIARLGQLHLQRGFWNGSQLLPEQWVEQASSPQITTALPFPDAPADNPDWQQGYGFQFWMARHGYRGDGAFGQFCVILPEQDAVVAITSQTVDMQETLNAVWSELLPAFSGPAAGSNAAADADERLLARLRELALPLPDGVVAMSRPAAPASAAPGIFRSEAPASGEVAPEPAAPDSPVLVGPAGLDEATFLPRGGSCREQPTLRTIRLAREAAGWRITLDDESVELSAVLAEGRWSVADVPMNPVAIAIAGGWRDDTTLRVDVVFIETPHRMRITCDSESREFTLRWVTEPLRLVSTPLSDLGTPVPFG